jgi:hypothetical protein
LRLNLSHPPRWQLARAVGGDLAGAGCQLPLIPPRVRLRAPLVRKQQAAKIDWPPGQFGRESERTAMASFPLIPPWQPGSQSNRRRRTTSARKPAPIVSKRVGDPVPPEATNRVPLTRSRWRGNAEPTNRPASLTRRAPSEAKATNRTTPTRSGQRRRRKAHEDDPAPPQAGPGRHRRPTTSIRRGALFQAPARAARAGHRPATNRATTTFGEQREPTNRITATSSAEGAAPAGKPALTRGPPRQAASVASGAGERPRQPAYPRPTKAPGVAPCGHSFSVDGLSRLPVYFHAGAGKESAFRRSICSGRIFGN